MHVFRPNDISHVWESFLKAKSNIWILEAIFRNVQIKLLNVNPHTIQLDLSSCWKCRETLSRNKARSKFHLHKTFKIIKSNLSFVKLYLKHSFQTQNQLHRKSIDLKVQQQGLKLSQTGIYKRKWCPYFKADLENLSSSIQQ